jgi:hypothetical protein
MVFSALLSVAALLAACSAFDLLPFSVSAFSPSETTMSSMEGVHIEIDFTKAANRTLTEGAFSLTADGSSVAGRISWPDDRSLVFTPDEPLASKVLYEMHLATSAEDTHGRDLSAELDHTFTTRSELSRPRVVGVTPDDHASTADTFSPVTVSFSEAMDEASLLSAFSLSPSVTGIYSLSSDGTTLTFTPGEALAWQSDYSVTIAKGAADLQGNTLGADYASHFHVGTESAPPEILSVKSGDGSASLTPDDPSSGNPTLNSGWESDQGLVVTFTEPVLTSSAIGAVQLSPEAQYTVAEENAEYTSAITLTLDGRLSYGTTYHLSIASGIQDTQGNKMVAPASYYFTVDGARTQPPAVSQVCLEVIQGNPSSAAPINPYGAVSLSSYGGSEGFFDIFLELAPGATVDPLTVARAVTISAANGAASFQAVSFELNPGGDPNLPPNPSANNAIVRIGYLITDNTSVQGIITLTVGTGLVDSRGTALSSDYVLPFNKTS